MNAVSAANNETSASLAICRRASKPYLQAGRSAFYFARCKLATDPLFIDLLVSGALNGSRHLLDLGCGQGLLAAWLTAAQAQRSDGDWPTGWPEPPRPARIRGVDLRGESIRRAKIAWGDRAQFDLQDIRDADCNGADAVLLFDVLHYIEPADQQALLHRIRGALRPGGVLMLRVADAAGGFPFKLSNWIDQLNDLVSNGRRATFYCRTLSQWLELLQSSGFSARLCETSSGRSFANRLLIAHVT